LNKTLNDSDGQDTIDGVISLVTIRHRVHQMVINQNLILIRVLITVYYLNCMESNTIIVTEIRVNEIVFQKNALKTTLLKVPNTILKHMSGEKHAVYN
jgi:hypothetical protein